ncbi:MAG: hypothetical protein V4688_02120 [Pseudomonadota bacterium]
MATGNGFTGSGGGGGSGAGSDGAGAAGTGSGLAVVMLGGAAISMACMTLGGSGNVAGFA